MTLGDFLSDFVRKVYEDGAPPDSCVLCGSTSALLHPVERAWACSRCHQPLPPQTEAPNEELDG